MSVCRTSTSAVPGAARAERRRRTWLAQVRCTEAGAFPFHWKGSVHPRTRPSSPRERSPIATVQRGRDGAPVPTRPRRHRRGAAQRLSTPAGRDAPGESRHPCRLAKRSEARRRSRQQVQPSRTSRVATTERAFGRGRGSAHRTVAHRRHGRASRQWEPPTSELRPRPTPDRGAATGQLHPAGGRGRRVGSVRDWNVVRHRRPAARATGRLAMRRARERGRLIKSSPKLHGGLIQLSRPRRPSALPWLLRAARMRPAVRPAAATRHPPSP
jgi:hypothetical protein